MLGDSQEQQTSWQEQVPSPLPQPCRLPPAPLAHDRAWHGTRWQRRNVLCRDSAPASQRKEKNVFGATRQSLMSRTRVASRVQVTSAPGLGSVNGSTVGIWGQIILGCGDCPVLCRMLNSISSFYPPDASGIFLSVITKNISRHCQISLEGKITPGENAWANKYTPYIPAF